MSSDLSCVIVQSPGDYCFGWCCEIFLRLALSLFGHLPSNLPPEWPQQQGFKMQWYALALLHTAELLICCSTIVPEQSDWVAWRGVFVYHFYIIKKVCCILQQREMCHSRLIEEQMTATHLDDKVMFGKETVLSVGSWSDCKFDYMIWVISWFQT